MNEQNNQIIIENSSNKKEENKNISPNDKDDLKLSQSGNKLFNKDENSTFNIKSSINDSVKNFEISTFKKEDWNKPIKIYSKEEIINNMNIIFLNYSVYFLNKDIYLISIDNIIKIIKEIGFLPDVIKLYQIDILIKKVCSNLKFIGFEDFMSIFIKLAQKIFPNEFNSNKDLLLNHFFHSIFTLYNIILTEENIPIKDLLKYSYTSITSLTNIIPDDSQILVLNSLLYTLNEIYEKYFVKNKKINYSFKNNQNLSHFFDFCRDFEIHPYIFNETQMITYFNTIIEKKDLFKLIDDSNEKKNTFTFNNFILFFIHLAEYNYAKIYQNINEEEKKVTQLSKLIMILTRMECSKGMRAIIINTIPNLSLMPNKELLLKYNFIFKKDSETFDTFIADNKIIDENNLNNGSEKSEKNMNGKLFDE